MTSRDRARIDWEKGMKPGQIAKKYGISVNTVKSWMTRHWKKESGAPAFTEEVHPHKRGAPENNQNGKGHGAPKGNRNSFKHGIYETVYWDTLTEEEERMIENMRLDDEEAHYEDQLRLLTIRERRLLRRIEEYNIQKGGLALNSVTKRVVETEGNLIKGSKQTQTETTTRTISTFEVIQRMEAELTRMQGKKTKCIDSLTKLRNERRKLEEESKGSDFAIGWVDAIEYD